MSEKVDMNNGSSDHFPVDKVESSESNLNSVAPSKESSTDEEKREFLNSSCGISKPSLKQKRYRNAWGNLSYANLIAAAILSNPKQKMKLNEIYRWFVCNVPYFGIREDEIKSRGWKNSIRHNLSLKPEFKRESGDKKAGYWCIDKDKFLQRLNSENRQINDPQYNKDMELFERFVANAYNYADRLREKKSQMTFESKRTTYFPVEMIRYPLKPNECESSSNYSECISKTLDFQKMQISETGADVGLSKYNPFQTPRSSMGQNYMNMDVHNNYQITNGLENYTVYSGTETPVPRATQITPMMNMGMFVDPDLSQAYYSHDFQNTAQYLAYHNYAYPVQQLGVMHDQPQYYGSGGYPIIDCNYFNGQDNRSFSNPTPILMNTNPFSQDYQHSAQLKNESYKPLVNL